MSEQQRPATNLGPRQLAWLRQNVPHFAALEAQSQRAIEDSTRIKREMEEKQK